MTGSVNNIWNGRTVAIYRRDFSDGESVGIEATFDIVLGFCSSVEVPLDVESFGVKGGASL